jgi:TRAP transporter TAXI family solute receptor
MATPPVNPGPNDNPTPKAPSDFGATAVVFLQAAYFGKNDFANDPQGPRKHLRLIANVQEPIFYLFAVKADSGITDLKQIVEKRLPVKMVARSMHSRLITPEVLAYYGISEERLRSFGGGLAGAYTREAETDVIIGFASISNTPEYNAWHQATQRYDLRYLEMPRDLRERLAKQFDLQLVDTPLGLFRGVDRPIPTIASFGTAVYGRTDMPDDFAYTLAKALDEQQELLAWTHMAWSYNWRTVWKALDVPLHPGAAKYYKEVGYMK